MFTVTITNQKGGVGKTTTAVTLAAGLAAAGRRVLLIDLDPQGHVALSLGLEKAPGLYRLLAEAAPLAEVITRARPGLDAILSDPSTDRIKRTGHFRDRIIADQVAVAGAAGYDVAIIDLAPSLDILQVAALVAADWLIIPTRLDFLAIDGINEAIKTMAEVAGAGHPIKGLSILPCQFDRTTRETVTQLETLTAHFADQLWLPIPTDTRVREAPAYGKTLWEYAPDTAAVVGFESKGRKVGGYAAALDRLKEVIDNDR